jgi:hypothetical protein
MANLPPCEGHVKQCGQDQAARLPLTFLYSHFINKTSFLGNISQQVRSGFGRPKLLLRISKIFQINASASATFF